MVAHGADQVDRHIEYDTFHERPARWVRLLVTHVPPGMQLGVLEFTAFGRH